MRRLFSTFRNDYRSVQLQLDEIERDLAAAQAAAVDCHVTKLRCSTDQYRETRGGGIPDVIVDEMLVNFEHELRSRP
jgi:hypothetical protein